MKKKILFLKYIIWPHIFTSHSRTGITSNTTDVSLYIITQCKRVSFNRAAIATGRYHAAAGWIETVVLQRKWWEISQSRTNVYTRSVCFVFYTSGITWKRFSRGIVVYRPIIQVYFFISRQVNKFLRVQLNKSPILVCRPLLIACCKCSSPRDLYLYTYCVTCFTISSSELIIIETFFFFVFFSFRKEIDTCLELLPL